MISINYATYLNAYKGLISYYMQRITKSPNEAEEKNGLNVDRVDRNSKFSLTRSLNWKDVKIELNLHNFNYPTK